MQHVSADARCEFRRRSRAGDHEQKKAQGANTQSAYHFLGDGVAVDGDGERDADLVCGRRNRDVRVSGFSRVVRVGH